MAGSWLKVRWNLSRDARVLAMAETLGMPPTDLSARAVSFALVEVWGLVMEQGNRDGDDAIMYHATLATLDRVCDTPRFGEAMEGIDWVKVETFNGKRCLRFPKLLRDNKLVSEQRNENAERQRKYREKSRHSEQPEDISDRNALRDVTRSALLEVTRNGADKRREEEIREEPKTENPIHVDSDESTRAVDEPKPEFSQRVERIYDACTWRKEKPREAKKAIVKAGKRVAARYLGDKDKAFEFLMARVLAYAKSPYVQTTDRQYLPLPASWFNADRFDDPDEAWNQTRKEQTNGTKPTRRADGTREYEFAEPGLLNPPMLARRTPTG